MGIKEAAKMVKYGAIAVGLGVAGYIGYKIFKGLTVIPEVFGDIQESLVKDIDEYEELADFEQAILEHGECISYTVEYKGAWALFGLGTIVTDFKTKSKFIELLDATQSNYPQENKVNMCYMNHLDGFRTFLGTGNQILNYQAELPETKPEVIEPRPSILPVSPIDLIRLPIITETQEEYFPVSPAITQEIYEQNIIVQEQRIIEEQEKEIRIEEYVEVYVETHPEVSIPEATLIAYQREKMEYL